MSGESIIGAQVILPTVVLLPDLVSLIPESSPALGPRRAVLSVLPPAVSSIIRVDANLPAAVISSCVHVDRRGVARVAGFPSPGGGVVRTAAGALDWDDSLPSGQGLVATGGLDRETTLEIIKIHLDYSNPAILRDQPRRVE